MKDGEVDAFWFEQLLTFQFILDKEQCNLRWSGDLILNRMIVVAVCCVLHILVGSKGHSSYICLSFGFFPKSPPAQGLRQYEEDKYSAQQGKAAHDNEGQGQPDAGKDNFIFTTSIYCVKNLE